MTKIKVCGIMESSDALVAAQAGADFIGLVFVPERRRRLDEDKALRIVSHLRENVAEPPKIVGLFADQPPGDVDRMVEHCGLDMVQLCGIESLDYCRQVGAPVIKVLHVSGSSALEDAVPSLAESMTALNEQGHLVTLDRLVEGLQGGTGQSFNWDIARALSERRFHFLLAGGLTPDNVGRGINAVAPWGVDVSSGVETNGMKDEAKIRAFIQTVRQTGPSTWAETD
jgi:phosphoribosylanthranilate isomerase